jgi:hypothetical protein
MIVVNLSQFKVQIAPTLMLGNFIDWVNVFKTALFQGLKESNVSKSGKGGYQLMTIDADIDDGQIIMLEVAPPPQEIRRKSTSSMRSAYDAPQPEQLDKRFVANARDLKVHIDRDIPPSKTHTHLNEVREFEWNQQKLSISRAEH